MNTREEKLLRFPYFRNMNIMKNRQQILVLKTIIKEEKYYFPWNIEREKKKKRNSTLSFPLISAFTSFE